MRYLVSTFTITAVLFISSCRDEDDTPRSVLGGPSQDLELGMQVRDEIESNPSQFPIMPESTEDQINAYNFLRNQILTPILADDDVKLADQFAYQEVKIIADTTVLNAFATPGGYIYVYAGLILYLDELDHLVGVLGHEIAHAERRHSMKQLEKQYGISILLAIITGSSESQLTEIAAQIAGTTAALAFSRSDEAEADEFAVKYTESTDYACNGVAGFFEKLTEQGGSRVPEFLSTHPNPENRVNDINAFADDINCSKTLNPNTDYDQFKQWILNGL